MRLKETTQNDLSILTFLDACHREITSVTPSAVNLPELMRQQVANLRFGYSETFTQLQRSREHVQGLQAQKRQMEGDLRKLLRHVFQNVRRKLNHPQMTSATLNHFGLDADGKLGKNKDRIKQPTLLAQVALEANRAAADYGFDFMQDPDAAVIEALIYELNDLYERLHRAEDDQRRWLEQIRNARFEVRSLQMMIGGYLKAQLRNRDDVYRRNVMRAYGFEYRSSEREAVPDPDALDDTLNQEEAA